MWWTDIGWEQGGASSNLVAEQQDGSRFLFFWICSVTCVVRLSALAEVLHYICCNLFLKSSESKECLFSFVVFVVVVVHILILHVSIYSTFTQFFSLNIHKEHKLGGDEVVSSASQFEGN